MLDTFSNFERLFGGPRALCPPLEMRWSPSRSQSLTLTPNRHRRASSTQIPSCATRDSARTSLFGRFGCIGTILSSFCSEINNRSSESLMRFLTSISSGGSLLSVFTSSVCSGPGNSVFDQTGHFITNQDPNWFSHTSKWGFVLSRNLPFLNLTLIYKPYTKPHIDL